ncbi:MAG: GNAT family N-acetyltransferase [Spirochaetaceae bacterium]|jgi:L-amino acid N-acyltransferase YncA|nr:GNAT family N-acetyltransferase [Spirochaetaceae bacterium]
MELMVRKYTQDDLNEMIAIWNSVVEGGVSFPQDEPLDNTAAESFFAGQSYTGVADDTGEIVGLYIVHPNNIGRCGHIANASYAVKEGRRGKHIGERLVKHSLETASSLSFRILQFNAVVASNKGAIHLYRKLGFIPLGTIPGGFRMDNGVYADIIPFYITLPASR